jgi:LPPG:FO 2-phospho-L-lactate transferase
VVSVLASPHHRALRRGGRGRFLQGLLHGIATGPPGGRGDAEVTVIANTGDDWWVHG